MNITKSKYCSFWQCPKMLWLKLYKPELFVEDPSVTARLTKGNEVGDLAMRLFGDFTEVTTLKEDGTLDYAAMIEKTKECLNNGTQNICEAAFSTGNLYCAVDILHKENGGYAIYEVKSSTELKYIYIVDVAFQKYVLQKCGINVTGTYVVHVNSKYIRDENLELDKLFTIEDVSSMLADEEAVIENNLAEADRILSSQTEPNLDIAVRCIDPYDCGFWQYCTKHLPSPSVFDVYGMKKRAFKLYEKGCVTFEDLQASKTKLNNIQQRQIDYTLHDKGTFVDKAQIKAFLQTLSYPLYFLDFEGMQPVVPPYPQSWAYEQVPFQYSLHYIESENGELKHKEFLGVSGEDPRRAIAESLCENIPENVCTLVFNKNYECTRLKELAQLFPDLSKHLLNIRDHVIDLLVPFQNGYYYKKEIGGSFSIKSVLPAICPNDPSLDYHALDEVHNGTEAMNIFPLIKDMPPEQAEETRKNLLKYCELDTLALVKLWQELKRVSK